MKNIIKQMLGFLGFGLLSRKRLDQLLYLDSDYLELFKCAAESAGYSYNGTSQLGQDIFAAMQAGWKNSGFFVEFGATDGVRLSNTYFLENQLGWTGILAEPAIVWQEMLRKNRNSIIDTRCVWAASNESLLFDMADNPEFSTLNSFGSNDEHSKIRATSTSYTVQTVSLTDLLDQHCAPAVIDYLSIDTEGSEYKILSTFDFERYIFKCITCEHNYTQDRELIFQLLSSKGYKRVLPGVSKWDDWYVYVG